MSIQHTICKLSSFLYDVSYLFKFISSVDRVLFELASAFLLYAPKSLMMFCCNIMESKVTSCVYLYTYPNIYEKLIRNETLKCFFLFCFGCVDNFQNVMFLTNTIYTCFSEKHNICYVQMRKRLLPL